MKTRIHAQLLSLAALIGLATLARPAAAEVREEFHQTYTLAETGRVGLANVDGDIHISAWDRNEVQVDAVKRGKDEHDLAEVKIEIEAKESRLNIRTEYPKGFWDRHRARHVTVDYTLRVPRGCSLKEISSVNGRVEILAVHGDVEAKTVNGAISAHGLVGAIGVSSVNGSIDFDLTELSGNVSAQTVNGGITMGIPANASARLSAHTVNGGIGGDFAGSSHSKLIAGRSFEATIGNGDRKVEASTVNGAIHFHQSKSMAEAKP